MIGIQEIATFTTGDAQPLQQLLAAGTLKQEEQDYYRGTGIRQVYNANEYTAYDLAKSAAVKVLDQAQVPAASLDLLIYIQARVPGHLISSPAAKLQFELKATNANFVAIGDLGCADMSMALRMGRDFLQGNATASYVLICFGSKPYTPSRFRYPVTVNGDGGTAVLLARTPKNEIVDIRIKSNGKYWDLFQVDYQGKDFNAFREQCRSVRSYAFELALESRNEFVKMNQQILTDNGWEKNKVAHFLMQNLSMRAFDYYEEALQISIDKACRENLATMGHLGPGDVMSNYATALAQETVQPGDKVLIMNNSPVAVWSAILIKA